MGKAKERILVIRLGALGDMVFCFQAFHDIRQAHPDADIALLVRAPFVSLAEKMPWFDRLIIDTHPTIKQPGVWMRLVAEIKAFGPTRVYDLQGKRRQSILFALLGGPFGPQWSGAVPLCHFPRLWPPLPTMSFRQFLAAQLKVAGVSSHSPASVTWLDAPPRDFSLPQRYIILVPGSSPAAPQKRWSAQKFAELADLLKHQGITSLVVGTKMDAEVIASIQAATHNVRDMSGQTDIFELAHLLRHASAVIGNDTGPVHMAGALGTVTLALFSRLSSPIWSTPPGDKVTVLQKPDLNDLSVQEVFATLTKQT